MQGPTGSDDERGALANRLYWETERSVNRIAEELDVSKGTLYGIIQPLRSGLPCPECGAELEYPNRTARDRGFLACPACGLEEEAELVREAWRERPEVAGSVSDVDGRPERSARATSDFADPAGRALMGAALVGVAAALLLILWARRK